MQISAPRTVWAALMTLLLLASCGDETEQPVVWECQLQAGSTPEFALQVGCEQDFLTLASTPMDSSLPGARSLKVVVDQMGGDKLYYQNVNTYQIHWQFVSKHLSGNGLPIVPALSQFNQTEYYSPSRRFLLGAVTYYRGPRVWAYEIAPYDSASAEMITRSFEAIKASAYFGAQLKFHPTSVAVTAEAKKLPASVQVVTTDELYAGTDYQALNMGLAMGRLRFYTSAQLETEYVSFRDIVVLDRVPNDISVVMGIITGEFQTPLSHINVLSQNRGTPNMGLRGASTNSALLALKDKWVSLEVKAFEYTIKEVTAAEAAAWWDKNKPTSVQVSNMDLTVTDLRDIDKVLDSSLAQDKAIKKAIPAFGGKASHYGAMAGIGADVPVPKAFAVPVYYYQQFLQKNGFDLYIKQMLADAAFINDPAVRDKRLLQLRQDMRAATVDPTFAAALTAKLTKDYPNTRMRLRSSTNAEDLDGYTGAGLYTSVSGDPSDPTRPVMDAVREVWSSVWYFRAFEERTYRSIDHLSVGMALLVHRSFPGEEANGVALTANPFDSSGLEPGLYVNVQYGEASVVKPESGITTDQFIYHYSMPGQPVVFISRSNLVPSGTTVLSTAQTYKLGKALDAIHKHFLPSYGPAAGDTSSWYAMDVEFKFDGEAGQEPSLYVKQARPHPGRGQ